MTIFLDIAPIGGGVAIFAAVAFFLIFLAIAYIAFRLLKKTVKMIVRMVIVGLIVAVAVAGSIVLYSLGSGSSPRSQPRPTRNR